MANDFSYESERSRVLSVPDHAGERYESILRALHDYISPRTYLEIGTQGGKTLALSTCKSIAVDPEFKITSQTPIGRKPVCALFQMTSDAFFAEYDPTALFRGPIDFAFLDGLHLSEYLLRDFSNTERYCDRNSIIAMHDCIPVEVSVAGRENTKDRIEPHRRAWWAGDVWRTVVALKRHRPDLEIICLDAPPTGLVVVHKLDPWNRDLETNYTSIVNEMMSMNLAELGVDWLFSSLAVEESTPNFSTIAAIAARLRKPNARPIRR